MQILSGPPPIFSAWRRSGAGPDGDGPDARALASRRIGIAAVLLLQAYAGGRDLLNFVGSRGIVQRPISDFMVHSSLLRLQWLYGPAAMLGISDTHLIFSCLGLHMLALALLLVGWRSRLTAAVAWLSYLTLKASGPAAAYGAYEFGNIALFYCFVMPVGLSLSVDAQSVDRSRRWAPYLVGCRSVLRAHLCIVYLSSGIAKASGSQWWNGEAIWRALMRPSLSLADFSWLAWVPALPTAIGWSVLALELSYAFLAWFPRARPFLLAAILAMHAGIAVVLGLWFFSGLLIVLNWAALAASSPTRTTSYKMLFNRQEGADSGLPLPVGL